ncbi:uncharacterized protein LOC125946675 [Dermacentor silvarum]|uniref:uncharacterized protein LOC125946675 n=1 Tax=Dermacentor silvarum TaxID=543639 RepID=UPI00210154C1|nr:uncharacterized protein LOC125946675 [Dermacentor silvarum]
MATEGDQPITKAAENTTAMTETTVAQIEASAVPDVTSGPLDATADGKPEVPSAKLPPQGTAADPPEEQKQQKRPREDIQPEHYYMVLLEDVLSADQGRRGRDGGGRAAEPGGSGGGYDRAGRHLAEPLDATMDDDDDVLCGERCAPLNRVFGLPLLGLAFVTIVLPVTVHRFSSGQNATQQPQLHGTSGRLYPTIRPGQFNYLADRMLRASATTAKQAAPWQARNNSAGIGRVMLDWQRLLGTKWKTDTKPPTSAPPSVTSTTGQNSAPRESPRPQSASNSAYGAQPPSRGVDKKLDGSGLPHWEPPMIGPQNFLGGTRRFFEKRTTLPTTLRDSSAGGGENPHEAHAEDDGRRRSGEDQGLPYGSGPKGNGTPKGGAPGGATGEPVPPLSGSQLWCVYQPPGVHDAAVVDDDEYQLDDVPVSLCTAVVYCCLDVWKHGVRTYQAPTARPRDTKYGRWDGTHPEEEYKHDGDGGPQGIYHFSGLRTARGAPPTLRLYAMLGGRDQTTFSFTRKMAAGSSGDEALSDDQDASGGRRRQLNRRENTVGSEKARGALWNTAQSRPINYTVLDKTVDLSARWLRRMRLDGFVFNYRSDPHYPRADPLYLLYFRAFHERLGEHKLHATLVLPDALTSTGNGSTDRKRRAGATSVARLVATGYTPLVLPTHDLVPQDRELNGDEHGRNHGSDDAAPAAGQEQHDEPILPPPVSGLSPYGVNGTCSRDVSRAVLERRPDAPDAGEVAHRALRQADREHEAKHAGHGVLQGGPLQATEHEALQGAHASVQGESAIYDTSEFVCFLFFFFQRPCISCNDPIQFHFPTHCLTVFDDDAVLSPGSATRRDG